MKPSGGGLRIFDSSPVVDVVAPHGHGDHINPEFIYALIELGYTIGNVFVHADDMIYMHDQIENVTNPETEPVVVTCSQNTRFDDGVFTVQPLGSPFVPAGGLNIEGIPNDIAVSSPCANPCPQGGPAPMLEVNGTPLVYHTTLSADIWFQHRPGHTRGAIDLVIERTGVGTRWVIRGSGMFSFPVEDGGCGVQSLSCSPIAIPSRTFEPHGNVRNN